MAQQGKPDDLITFQELAVSNSYEIAALVALLERKGLILRGPKLGHSHAWRLNPDYGYKGDPEGKVCQPDGKKTVFRVIDGGKKD